MATSATPITGIPGTTITTQCGQPATGTVTNSADIASPLQAIQNNFATLTAGSCTLAAAFTFSGACTFSNQVALQGLTTANDINVTGQLTCEAGSVTLLTGNCYAGAGTTLLTASTVQIGGLTATPIGAAPWGKLLCTAHSTAEFDGAVTSTGGITCTGGLTSSAATNVLPAITVPTGGVTVAGAVGAGDTPAANTLYGSNVVKARGYLHINSGTVTVLSAFNLNGTPTITTGGHTGITLQWLTSMADTNYMATGMDAVGSATLTTAMYPVGTIPLNTSTVGCQLVMWTGSAFQDWTSGEHFVSFVVYAAQ